jgi:hypothetical protein
MFFLAARFYEPQERKSFLRVTAKAVWHGLLCDFTVSFQQVVEFSQISSER